MSSSAATAGPFDIVSPGEPMVEPPPSLPEGCGAVDPIPHAAQLRAALEGSE